MVHLHIALSKGLGARCRLSELQEIRALRLPSEIGVKRTGRVGKALISPANPEKGMESTLNLKPYALSPKP